MGVGEEVGALEPLSIAGGVSHDRSTVEANSAVPQNTTLLKVCGKFIL